MAFKPNFNDVLNTECDLCFWFVKSAALK
uniref:Uncharacterized protein n=1 Tax=Tetranychus urticae TaxID=32264 RepID=T1K3N7_TETUR